MSVSKNVKQSSGSFPLPLPQSSRGEKDEISKRKEFTVLRPVFQSVAKATKFVLESAVGDGIVLILRPT